MERKAFVGLFCNIVGNGIFVPAILAVLNVPAPVIAAVAAASMIIVALWGHAPAASRTRN